VGLLSWLRRRQVDIPAEIDRLLTGEYEASKQAVERLARAGRPALPALVAALTHSETFRLGQLGKAFRKIGRRGLAALVDALRHGDARIRAGAAWALGEFEGRAETATAALLRNFNDPDARARGFAIRAVGMIAPGDPSLRDAAAAHGDDPDPDVRYWTLVCLDRLGLEAARALPLYERALGDADGMVRKVAASALGRLGPEARPAAAALTDRLGDPEDHVREAALEALGKVGAGGPACEAALQRIVEGPEAGPREKALLTLWEITRDPARVVPGLLRLAGEEGAGEALCDLVASIGPPAAALVPPLIQAMEKDDYDLLWAAADALAAIGPGAREAVPVLVRRLGHPSGLVGTSTARALAAVGPEAYPAVLQAFLGGEPRVKEYAADALGLMGSAAAKAVPALRQAFEEVKETEARCWFAIALAEIARDPEVAPILTVLVRKAPGYIARRAARGLGCLSDPGPEAVRALERAARSPDEDLAREARESLRRVRGI
jgi:HEAT repeat protein